MDVQTAIRERRAYRSLAPVEVTSGLVNDLVHHASLAPSCFNHQPWRYDFVYGPRMLQKMHASLMKGNEWARAGSMIIAVYTRKDYDCDIKGREYYLFDVGLSTAFLILRATELGLVAHPIAGYEEDRVKEILELEDEVRVITLVIVGKHTETISSILSDKQVEAEETRPERMPFDRIAHIVR